MATVVELGASYVRPQGLRSVVLKAVIQFTKPEEIRALPILLRHSAAAVLPNRTYVLDQEAVTALLTSGIRFVTLSHESYASSLEGVGSGERI